MTNPICPATESFELVLGDTKRAVVLCPTCGAAVQVDSWIRGIRPGRDPLLRARTGTLSPVPEHEIRNPAL